MNQHLVVHKLTADWFRQDVNINVDQTVLICRPSAQTH